MRRRTSYRTLVACIAGLTCFAGTTPAVAAEPNQTEPIRLTAVQMDSITAGTALVATDALATVAGDRALALTAAQTFTNLGANSQQVGGGSSAVAAGSTFAATNSSTIVGNGRSNTSLALDASSAASGGSVAANAFTQALAFDSAVAEVAVGLAQSFAGGGGGNAASATSEVGGSGGVIAGSVTRLVQTPQYSIAQATAFAITINSRAASNRNARSATGNRIRCAPRSSAAGL